MKMLWRLSREAIRYRFLYVIAICSTLLLTAVNLTAPKVLSSMTGIVERGVDEAGLRQIGLLTVILLGLYLLRILFRFLRRTACSRRQLCTDESKESFIVFPEKERNP